MIKIAIDGMGGDRSPLMVIGGILRAAQRYPDVHFILFGNRDKIQPLLAK
ncbi:MAG: phosphate acyltransferase, partial [Alphaproteobacteria bacterium]|nr:phosphate acyltransferase [Alphaproteobacteria bacterium]